MTTQYSHGAPGAHPDSLPAIARELVATYRREHELDLRSGALHREIEHGGDSSASVEKLWTADAMRLASDRRWWLEDVLLTTQPRGPRDALAMLLVLVSRLATLAAEAEDDEPLPERCLRAAIAVARVLRDELPHDGIEELVATYGAGGGCDVLALLHDGRYRRYEPEDGADG